MKAGGYDDVCYLRQAHLFQRFGLDGLNTDISRDDDRYRASKLKEIGFPTWSDPATAPIWHYLADMQFVLPVPASAWTALILRLNRGNGITQTAVVAAGNLLVNLAFFMSHPVFTPYYVIPATVLSLWSLLFAGLMQPAEAVNVDFPGRPARA